MEIWDIAITVGLSLIIAVISLVMMQDANRNSVSNLLEMNRDYILKLRDEGKAMKKLQNPLQRNWKAKSNSVRL